jgi:hypothetical protein
MFANGQQFYCSGDFIALLYREKQVSSLEAGLKASGRLGELCNNPHRSIEGTLKPLFPLPCKSAFPRFSPESISEASASPILSGMSKRHMSARHLAASRSAGCRPLGPQQSGLRGSLQRESWEAPRGLRGLYSRCSTAKIPFEFIYSKQCMLTPVKDFLYKPRLSMSRTEPPWLDCC